MVYMSSSILDWKPILQVSTILQLPCSLSEMDPVVLYTCIVYLTYVYIYSGMVEHAFSSGRRCFDAALRKSLHRS